MQTQAEHASVLGGISARISTRSVLQDTEKLHASIVLSAKGLNRNSDHLTRLICETLESPDFSETSRIKDLISQVRARRESSITGRGHSFAMTAASSRHSVSAALGHRWGGLHGLVSIKDLDDQIQKEESVLTELVDKFKQIHELVRAMPSEWLIVSEEGQQQQIRDSIAQRALSHNGPSDSGFAYHFDFNNVRQAWSTNSQVNFCAKSYSAVPAGHKDAAVLTVLGEYLGNGFLHSAIREKGGAYGGGAGFDGESAAFRFYSYRDPRLQETMDDFDESVRWLMNGSHEERLLEEAILGVISRIDKPGSPAGEAIGNYYSERYGRGGNYVQELRQRILKLTIADLTGVAEKYLLDKPSSCAVVGAADKMSELSDYEQFSA